MKFRLVALSLMWGAGLIAAQEPVTPPAETATAEIPGVEAAIPDAVKALGEPAMLEFPGGIHMAVTAATDKAQEHVNQGLNHLHAGWEFEASRHFAAAMREDPDCLMAHWGMIMSVLTPSPETFSVRNAASARFIELLAAGQGSKLERGYATGLVSYIQGGPTAAGQAFVKVANEFPNDLQAAIFAALFNRGGYEELGNPTPDQEKAEKSLLALTEKFPTNPVPLNALLTIRAESPDLTASVELARKLQAMDPTYPPYLHLLGHYEWRTGNHLAAEAAFARAASGFKSWMTANKAGVADCPEWIRSETYRVAAIASTGDFDKAYTAARELAATPLPQKRLNSTGARMLLWEAKTMPARILLRRGLRGNADEALHSLPPAKDLKITHDASLAYLWIDGLRLALEARRLIDAGKLAEAAQVVTVISSHGENMAKSQQLATAGGERPAWNRGFIALQILASDLRGRVAMASPKTMGSAYNWYSSATDLQRPATMMLPPMLLSPMAIQLGEFYQAKAKPTEAIESYDHALVQFPNDLKALEGLKAAQEKAGLTKEAAATAALIKQLRGK